MLPGGQPGASQAFSTIRRPLSAAASWTNISTTAQARSLTSVKPGNFRVGAAARIAPSTNALTAKMTAAAVGTGGSTSSDPAVGLNASASASIHASAAALAAT